MQRQLPHFLFTVTLVTAGALAACSRDPVAKDKEPAPPAVDTSLRARVHPGAELLEDQTGPGGQRTLKNREAVIPPQCYTRTEQRHNPCYVCHQNPNETEGHENRMRDGELQGDYEFTSFATKNRWTNLFVDRSQEVAKISDEEILAYVRRDNYDALLAKQAADDQFGGWKPDLRGLGGGARAFDAQGLAKDGSGWVAFNYMPMPSTFWPTNGSTDDVMIRLPESFRSAKAGGPLVRDVYLANLAILEAAIKNVARLDTVALDEARIGVDLDGNGHLNRTTRIVRPAQYVGAASTEKVERFLYPRGTEFLHTVRYVGVSKDGAIEIPAHMKEVRYMVKHTFMPAFILAGLYDNEAQEKHDGAPPYFADFRDQGVDTGFGWRLQGYLEDEQGELRPSKYEEALFCMGCHTTLGTTIDHTFAFGRKLEGAKGWGYIDLKALRDTPALGDTEGEIATYLERVGGGSEFRNNDEMRARWFNADGSLDKDKVKAAPNVYALITPSKERALQLNKAYRVIVREQSFLFGRDATVTPPANVFADVDREVLPLLPEHRYGWDIRLAWSPASAPVRLVSAER